MAMSNLFAAAWMIARQANSVDNLCNEETAAAPALAATRTGVRIGRAA